MFSCVFFFKQKTAYEMRISDWSSDVCSSDLDVGTFTFQAEGTARSKVNYSITNHPLAGDLAKTVVNFRIMWESENGRFNAQAFVTNALTAKYLVLNRDAVIGVFGAVHLYKGDPRLWGVNFGGCVWIRNTYPTGTN